MISIKYFRGVWYWTERDECVRMQRGGDGGRDAPVVVTTVVGDEELDHIEASDFDASEFVKPINRPTADAEGAQ